MKCTMKGFAAILMTLFLVTGAFGNGKADAGDSGNKSATVERWAFEPNGSLVIDLKTGGDVTVSAWDKNEVEITFIKRSAKPAIIEITTQASDTKIKVNSRYTVRNPTGNNRLDLEVKVPRMISVGLNSSGGDVNLSGFTGHIAGTTMGGNITMTRLEGTTEFKTMGGNIKVDSSRLNGSLTTMGGRIEISSVFGAFKALTMGGSIVYTGAMFSSSEVNVDYSGDGYLETMGGTIEIKNSVQNLEAKTMGGSINIGETAGTITASTMGGNITLDKGLMAAILTTMGGSITVGQAMGTIDASTNGGNIQIDKTNMAATLSTMGGSLTIKDANGSVAASSSGGNINVTVPENFPMTVDITLEITRNSWKNYIIKTALSLARTEEAGTMENDLKKTLYARGKTGEGTNLVTLTATNGTISLAER